MLQTFRNHFETVAFDPPDLLRYPIDFGIVLCTCKHFGIFLNGKDLVPASGERKSDGVTASATESVDQNILRLGCASNVLCYSSVMMLVLVVRGWLMLAQ